MIALSYPAYQPRLRRHQQQEQIWDLIRRRWVALTPEEWVRQHFIHFLVEVSGYPAALLAVEKTIRQGELSRRFDIVVFSRHHRPWLLVECKEPAVPLSQAVLDQALRYNLSLQVPFLAITNGNACRAFRLQEGKLEELTALPAFTG